MKSYERGRRGEQGLHRGLDVYNEVGFHHTTKLSNGRMESSGEAGRVQVSEAGGVRFRTTERGSIDIKGKGTMKTYWLE